MSVDLSGGFEFQLDTTEFRRAINFVYQNTYKEIPEIMNRMALSALVGGAGGVQGAIKTTPRAKKSDILAVPVKTMARAAMKRAVARGISLKGRHGLNVARAVRAEYGRRIAAIGYTARVGWAKAVVAFGGYTRIRPYRNLGLASLGGGKPATVSDLVALMVNTAPAADLIGRTALQNALNDVAREKIRHEEEKLQEIYNQA